VRVLIYVEVDCFATYIYTSLKQRKCARKSVVRIVDLSVGETSG
jgi:hypothetical protein